jgi:membrane-associated phospholipid phosphatase
MIWLQHSRQTTQKTTQFFLCVLSLLALTMTCLSAINAYARNAHAQNVHAPTCLTVQPPDSAAPFAASAGVAIGDILMSDLSIAWHDGLRFFSAPARFTGGDWALTAATVGATAALFPADEPLNVMMLRNRSRTADALAAVGREYGGLYGIALSGVVYGAGLITSSAEVRVTGRLMLQALLYSGLTTTILKSAFGRSRPYRDEGAFQFQPPQFDDSRLSLPSGHATVAFALSSVLAERIGNPWVGIGLYGLATLTALSRMYHTQHWASDVLLGGVIGTAAGLLVTHAEREREAILRNGSGGGAQANVHWYPMLTPYGVGVGCVVLLP